MIVQRNVLVVRPRAPGSATPHVPAEVACLRIDNTLEALQALVGGSIEGWSFNRDLFLICRAEGRETMPPCFFHPRLGVVHGASVIHACEGDDIGDLEGRHVMDVLRLLSDGGLIPVPEAAAELFTLLAAGAPAHVPLARTARRVPGL